MGYYTPTAGEIISNYYAVVAGSKYDNIGLQAGIRDLLQREEELQNTFLRYVEMLQEYEASKEEAFLTSYIQNLKSKLGSNNDIISKLESYLSKDNLNLSLAFDLVEKTREMLLLGFGDSMSDIESYNKYLESINNKFIVETFTKAVNSLGDSFIDKSPSEIYDYIIDFLLKEYSQIQQREDFNKYFQDFILKHFSPSLQNILKDTKMFKGGKWSQNFSSLRFSSKKSGLGSETIKEMLISKVIAGIVNGLGQEEYVSSLGGASTARATRNLSMFTSSRTLKVPTETDIYIPFSSEFKVDETLREKIAGAKTDTEIRELINLNIKDDFIIHTSSKDLSISVSSGGSAMAKIKGSGSLDSKISVLKELGSSMGAIDDVNSLIFKAINSGESLMYNPEGIDEVVQSLTSLALGFMFEDFNVQFEQISGALPKTGKELHVYYITGSYFTISDILKQLITQIETQVRDQKIVNVGFKPSPAVDVDAMMAKYHGQKAWEMTRNYVIKNTQMSISMNTTRLGALISQVGS